MANDSLLSGVRLGDYPERPPNKDSAFERELQYHVRRVRKPAAANRRLWGRFLKRVHGYADELKNHGANSLAAYRDKTKTRLRQEGLTEDAVAQSFALIREVSGRELGMRHFDVQLLGGWVMVEGMLAEMYTGEGKTLTATLPACTAALAGIPTHVVSVNDYLVKRDAEIMMPIYQTLGLSVGTVIEGMEDAQKQQAYGCHVTYCCNKQLVFDYLKDRLLLGSDVTHLKLKLESLYREQTKRGRLLLRGLCFAIVDEADSILIDEARTPLILSASTDNKELERMCHDALFVAGQLKENTDFLVHTKERQLEITPRGERRLEQVAGPLGGVWRGPRRRKELASQALSARHLFIKDDHYLVRDDKVMIIDENTGRVMPDRAWESGLHQMVEAKEGCEMSAQRETLAKISFQRFFSRYLRLSGMSGTVEEVRKELWSVYGLGVVPIPPNKPTRRIRYKDRVYRRASQKWLAVAKRCQEMTKQGRPVLVGTRSVADSELLSRALKRAKIDHQVLNARQDAEEAEVVSHAGECGRITVATNMAGRGTDISLTDEVEALGGLHVVCTERNIARRIDRQLAGRSARQGDPGSVEYILSLEDELVRIYFGERIPQTLAGFRSKDQTVGYFQRKFFMELPQRLIERAHWRVRKALLKVDEKRNAMLAFSGAPE